MWEAALADGSVEEEEEEGGCCWGCWEEEAEEEDIFGWVFGVVVVCVEGVFRDGMSGFELDGVLWSGIRLVALRGVFEG